MRSEGGSRELGVRALRIGPHLNRPSTALFMLNIFLIVCQNIILIGYQGQNMLNLF